MKKKHPPVYYHIRSAVRWALVLGIASAGMIGCIKVSEMGDLPRCDVRLNVNFTWNAEDFASLNPGKTLNDCLHPLDVVLDMDGTWDWYNPDL
jgi:hypothetical protein